MPLELVTIPCLNDNYAFLLHNADTAQTALIDAPEAAPVLEELERRGWPLTEIWLTHHHWDHVDGAGDIRAATGARLTGAQADAGRLPPLNRAVSPGETFDFAGRRVDVIEAGGHTLGHVAYHVPAARAVFTGDSLMALGCGRLFEGSAGQMWATLKRLAALPGSENRDTLVCSGHEYTQANARFALTIEPGNPALQARAARIEEARGQGRPTVPSLLSEELATNPFLRAGHAPLKAALGMEDSPDEAVFAEIRRRKDAF